MTTTRVTIPSARELRFLRRLAEHVGVCDRNQLYPADREEGRARQFCRRHGWAFYDHGYWRLTDAGHALLQEVRG